MSIARFHHYFFQFGLIAVLAGFLTFMGTIAYIAQSRKLNGQTGIDASKMNEMRIHADKQYSITHGSTE